MGKLMIEGKAAKEYAYDLMTVSITFWATEGSSSAALKRVMQQSEEFLSILDEAGLKIEEIHIGKDNTEKKSYDRKFEVEAKRELKICIPFNMDFVNFIRKTVQEHAFDADITTTYKFSNVEEIHEELIKLALEDSRTKAAYIADSMKQKVIGIDEMKVGNFKGTFQTLRSHATPDDGQMHYYDELLSMLCRRVQAPVSTESESVEVVWLIE